MSRSSSNNNSVKKLDEKNVKVLRELASLAANRQCFDCHQRGPTYVNTTVGAFVCTSCSGRLRGLNPPHRLKSMSMASFTAEEIEFVRLRGNEYCRKIWMGKFDKSRAAIDETSFKDETQMKDFLNLKYEKKRWYVNPNEVAFSSNNTAAQILTEQQPKNAHFVTKATTSVSSTTLIDPFATPSEKAAKQRPAQQADFANFDAFMSNGYSASKNLDMLSSLSPIPKSATLPTVTAPQPQQDKYSALKELDELFSNAGVGAMQQSSAAVAACSAATWSSPVASNGNYGFSTFYGQQSIFTRVGFHGNQFNPFFASANYSPPRAPVWPAPATTNPFLMGHQQAQFTNLQNTATNFPEVKSSSTNKAWNPFMN